MQVFCKPSGTLSSSSALDNWYNAKDIKNWPQASGEYSDQALNESRKRSSHIFVRRVNKYHTRNETRMIKCQQLRQHTSPTVPNKNTSAICGMRDDRSKVGQLSLKNCFGRSRIAHSQPCAIIGNHMHLLPCQECYDPRPIKRDIIAASLKDNCRLAASSLNPAHPTTVD